jgi:beta-glucosidase
MRIQRVLFACGIAIAATLVTSAASADDARPWLNAALDPDQRAALVVAQMTRQEKQQLVFAFFATDAPWKKFTAAPEARAGSAGYVPGIARLGIPPQWETDAGVGVATQGGAKEKRERTALPSGMAIAASWDPEVAHAGGAMIGAEARASGFNVILAGGVNLVREPRNGRNFEYLGEDPWLAGNIAAAAMKGIESNHIITTVKHYALNDQETDRNSLDVRIDPAQARMSDLLAFEIAIEQADPGSVMCSYNKVWGEHSCEQPKLLNDLLRKDWGWRGYVMSDWGATHSTAKAANAGLDQESGYPFDNAPYFEAPLLKAVEAGEVSEARLTEMAQRILRTMFAKGVVDHPVEIGPIDFKANAAVTRQAAEAGIVLLKNQQSILPLTAGMKRVAVIGGHADKGVLAGGGSSLVYPVGGNAVPGLKPTSWPGPVMYYPSAPLRAIQALLPQAKVEFADGEDLAAAAKLAAASDVALVFATQWNGESFDSPLTFENGQDKIVSAVAKANPRTVVVIESGGAMFMPWIDGVAGVVQAWYPGTAGGEAIANVLTGKVNPAGRLPISFPRDESQFARKNLQETDASGKKTGEINYEDGATVGYKWFDAHKQTPLFPFGFGLSYTRFEYPEFSVRVDRQDVVVKFKVKNVGSREGSDVPQVYISASAPGWEAPKRLGAFRKVKLAAGASTEVELRIDPRLLAVFADGEWRIAAGSYNVMLGSSSANNAGQATVSLAARTLPAAHAR